MVALVAELAVEGGLDEAWQEDKAVGLDGGGLTAGDVGGGGEVGVVVAG